MKNVLKSPKAYMLVGLLVIVVTASAWQLKGKKQSHDTTTGNAIASDTAHPRKHDIDEDEYGMKGFEEGMKQFDLQLANLNINLSGLDTIINKTVKQALVNIDFSQIGRNVDEAIKNIDWQEINANVNNSLKDAQEQLKNIDMNKIKMQVQDELDKINTKEFKVQFDGANLEKIIDDAMHNAMEGLDKAKWEVKSWADFTKSLERDGLINLKKGYKIEWKDNGDLYINGNKQSKEVADKYHKYYKEGGFTISSDGDETESL